MKGDFYLGAWLVEPSLGRVSVDGRTVQVRPKVMDLLVFLAGSRGNVISKETLLNEVWRTEAISESALTRTITELRSAVGDDAEHPRFLETIPKRGYRLIAPVRPVASADESISRRQRTPRLAIWIAIVLAAVSITLLVSVMAPAESVRVTPLTSLPGQEGQPAFSPDGKQVAVAWSGASDDNFDIYVKGIGEHSLVRLTTDPAPDQSPAWSPDGRAIAFVRGAGDGLRVYVVPAAGGAESLLGNLRRTWTPTWSFPRARMLDWFPDGRALAVADRSSPAGPLIIIRISIASGERQPLTSPPAHSYGDNQPDVSSDGRTLAFTRSLAAGASDIHIVPLTGGAPRRLTFDDNVITGLAWTADGRSIVFSSERGGAASAGNLWRVPAAAISRSQPEQLSGIGPRAILPAIATRGRLLAYQEFLADTNLWRVPSTGRGSPERLVSSTREENFADYAPDGARIAFTTNRSGSWEIWVSNADGSNPRRLTSYGGAPARTPRWSPNGRLLAFAHASEGNDDIYTVTSEGSLIQRLTQDPSRDEAPSWSRDGRWIYFSSNRSGTYEIWKLAIDQPTQMLRVTHRGGTNPLESADGQRLFYRKGGFPDFEIWSTPVNGGDERRALGPIRAAPPAGWVPDPNGIYFIEMGRIAYYKFATGETTPITALARDAVIPGSGLAMSPDGRWLLYGQRDSSGSDIMLVENFR